MLRGMRPDDVPSDVLRDVARACGAEVVPVSRLAGGVNGGAVRVRVPGRADAVLKVTPRTGRCEPEAAARARRVVDHMRRLGYPTPAWLGIGATEAHVWQLTDLVDGVPAKPLTASVVEQLMTIVDLQAGQGREPHDHAAYAWRVVTGREPVMAEAAAFSPVAAALVERLRRAGAGLLRPAGAPDMVHADLSPGNVLVRDGVVVAVVDIGNAGRGTRATDLVTLLWHTFEDPLIDVRGRLWTKVLDLVGPGWTAALVTNQVLLQLQWRVRLALRSATPEDDDAVTAVLDRGHRALDELASLG
jgi:aminoglycoside phosphotransferase (APT) family kinase protein